EQDWGERMRKEVGGMVHNGGTRESSDHVALPRPGKCPTARTDQYPTRAVTSSKWDLRTALVSSALQTVNIVWVKLDSLCRGELNHSNVPYSRFWSCVIRVIPTPKV
ncbi:Os07g0417766, partial [Oryza sativa Japonica Group]